MLLKGARKAEPACPAPRPALAGPQQPQQPCRRQGGQSPQRTRPRTWPAPARPSSQVPSRARAHVSVHTLRSTSRSSQGKRAPPAALPACRRGRARSARPAPGLAASALHYTPVSGSFRAERVRHRPGGGPERRGCGAGGGPVPQACRLAAGHPRLLAHTHCSGGRRWAAPERLRCLAPAARPRRLPAPLARPGAQARARNADAPAQPRRSRRPCAPRRPGPRPAAPGCPCARPGSRAAARRPPGARRRCARCAPPPRHAAKRSAPQQGSVAERTQTAELQLSWCGSLQGWMSCA